MTDEEIQYIIAKYGLNFQKTRKELALFGSPERTEYRAVFEDDKGKLYILEEIAAKRLPKKLQICKILQQLKTQNPKLPIEPYLENFYDTQIIFENQKYFQIQPYVVGIKLDREKYLDEAWRGKAAAKFLLELRKTALQCQTETEEFSLKKYVAEIIKTIEKHNPEILPKIQKIVNSLEEDLFQNYEKMPTAFCHGDYHPLNIIWSKKGIANIIDWEFCSEKVELYDAANMVGCLGMENPETLKKPIVKNFITDLKRSNLFATESWNNFPTLILALRFAWLSEWLRFKDQKIIQMEINYMQLLLENQANFQRIWEI